VHLQKFYWFQKNSILSRLFRTVPVPVFRELPKLLYIDSLNFYPNYTSMRKQYRLWQLMLLVCWCLATNLQAQDEVVLTPVTKTYAITNVNINQAPGKKIEMGTILIKDGVIKAVGKNITIPADAWVIKADSMQAYAGFIDGFSRTGVTKPKEEGRERLKDPGNPPPDKAGITPQSDVRTFINPADKAIDEWRNAGFTLAHVAPYGGMLPGQTALILLGGTGTDNMVLQNNAALYSELTPAERMYPNTIIGVMAKFRELYQQASLTKSYEAVYASNRNGLERPQPDRVLQAFYPVIDKKQAVAFKAEKVLDVQRVINLQKDLGFNLTLVDVKEGWDVINKIKNANAKVFLSLDLPEKKKEDKKEEKKEDKKDEKKEKKPSTNARKNLPINILAKPVLFRKPELRLRFQPTMRKQKIYLQRYET
jgi:hypothetical protein